MHRPDGDDGAGLIRSAIWNQQAGHHINDPDFARPLRSMSQIGGSVAGDDPYHGRVATRARVAGAVREAGRLEPHWPASLAVVAALVLQATLPDQLIAGPRYVLPILEAALLVPLTLSRPRRHHSDPPLVRIASLVLIALVNLANVISLGLLIRQLLRGGVSDGHILIEASIQIWLTNVIIFGLWYWELDRGGPGERTRPELEPPDFLFPQMANAEVARTPEWMPNFIDYLYVSFTNATAFSPTDTMPLTPWVKVLMAAQSLASLITVALVAARAVNILQT
ncbi:MAG: hypothetical protein ACR2GX_01315 [Candidatus Dormibacteria bacterium]